MPKSKNVSLVNITPFAKQFANQLKGGEILALTGPLGSGKTTFAQNLGKYLKIKSKITSPSFRLIHQYSGKTSRGKNVFVYHLDLYRTKNWKEVENLGIKEIWQNPKSIIIIEWANKIKSKLPKKAIWIKFLGL